MSLDEHYRIRERAFEGTFDTSDASLTGHQNLWRIWRRTLIVEAYAEIEGRLLDRLLKEFSETNCNELKYLIVHESATVEFSEAQWRRLCELPACFAIVEEDFLTTFVSENERVVEIKRRFAEREAASEKWRQELSAHQPRERLILPPVELTEEQIAAIREELELEED